MSLTLTSSSKDCHVVTVKLGPYTHETGLIQQLCGHIDVKALRVTGVVM